MNIKIKVVSTAFALSMALSALSGVTANAESNHIKYHDDVQTPSYIIEDWKAPAGLSKKEAAKAYLAKNSEKFQMMKSEAVESFEIKDEISDNETGTHHFKVNQLYKGIPVYGADQTLALDQDNKVTAYFGKVVPNLEQEKIDTKVSITKKEAIDIAKAGIEAEIGEVSSYDGEINLEPYIYEYKDEFYSTFLVTASTSSPEVGFWHYFIDTATGKVIDSFNAAHEVTAFGYGVFGGKQMFEASYIDGLFRLHDQTRGQGVITYDYDNNVNEDVTSVSKMFRDGAAVDAHANSQKTYDYFKNTFNRNSVDDNGQRLLSRVHVGDNWNNASWNGVYMSYGDGDGIRFHPLAGGLDVAAHEMSHGVIQHTASLIYRNESGALNESFADIFGAMVDRDVWIIGEDIMANGAIGLRSLEDPAALIENRTQEPYPDHWSKRYTGTLDNGGVHINSSINNKAAYLVSEGGEHYGVQVTGVGREATEQIYYRALSHYLTASSNFAMMRQAAIQAATDLYGSNSDAVKAVQQAYNAVGVY